jgi:Glycosyl transferase family 11
MITVLLNGGLGNQLFQYATGRALSLKHGVDLFLDLSLLNRPASGDTLRNFELGAFSCYDSLNVVDLMRKPCGNFRAAFNRILLSAGIRIKGQDVFKELGCSYNPLIHRAPAECIIEGFWQSERYFSHIKDLLLKELSLKAPSHNWTEAVGNLPFCSAAVHIRRGDYISNPVAAGFHGVCSQEYYRAAVDLVRQRYPDAVFLVFSDDPSWCRAQLDLGTEFCLAEDLNLNGPAEEMLLMSRCRHQIIANSSFSWWGAWLNSSTDKLVIAPSRWFSEPSVDTSDLVPEGWVRLA